jgi:hypothetical protein
LFVCVCVCVFVCVCVCVCVCVRLAAFCEQSARWHVLEINSVPSVRVVESKHLCDISGHIASTLA